MDGNNKSVYANFLKNVFFLKDLDEDGIGALAGCCREHSFGPADVIFTEGSPADRFYIILQGQVEVWKAYGEQEPSLLAVHGPGHFFGEMALVDQLPRSATLVARTETRTLYISRDDFQALIRSNNSIALSVMMSISLMVRSSNESFVEDLRRRNLQLQRANEELKAVQEELLRNERLSTIGKFSSLILHDIKNPIAVLKALSDLALLHAEQPEEAAKDVRRMKGELERLERLASDFLDYSRGEVRLSFGLSSAEALFRRVSEAFADRLEREGIALVLSDGIRRPIVLDEERFSRVLINLVDNARKAGSRGSSIRLAGEASEGEVAFTVEDEGEGMSGAVAARIFEPFFSASGKGGTGLGMLIVKNIVEAHEGTISVYSEPGAGTRVRVALPARI